VPTVRLGGCSNGGAQCERTKSIYRCDGYRRFLDRMGRSWRGDEGNRAARLPADVMAEIVERTDGAGAGTAPFGLVAGQQPGR